MMERYRDWQIDFGPVFGVAGTTTTVNVRPQCRFRGEKLIATDTGSTPGFGTRILSILVGQRSQRPTADGLGTLTAFFGQTALGNGVRWDVSDKALTCAVQVSFVETCTFDLSVFGKAVV